MSTHIDVLIHDQYGAYLAEAPLSLYSNGFQSIIFGVLILCTAKEKGVKVDRVYVGSFMTSLEMAGVSITLLHLDETRTHCLGKVFPFFRYPGNNTTLISLSENWRESPMKP